ncbi:alpha/beta fold hydrolase [Bacillus atrophaeus]|uniref:alpha/beta fold hydrolase n=1 Tax=Bacillus atrophaeus TaxID=1452 RepID=UPI0022814C70|nr:alpha/beta hydrolase [Bacillus atrophaeus]MCY8859362.1 alpha/beta hydrolase [Bacillus atrophaeus]
MSHNKITSKSGARFYQAYDESLSLWPVAYDTFHVSTSFGQTHIIASGPKDAPPLILLHGALFTSVMWYPNIAEWSSRYRTYAIDIIGDKNKSMPEKPCNTRSDYAGWLSEVFDCLGLEKAHVAGFSLGGLHAVNFVMEAPERVERAVIMSPAEAFIPFHPDFYKYSMGLAQPDGVEAFLQWMMADRFDLHPAFEKQFQAGIMWQNPQRGLKPKENGFPYVFSDQELKSVTVPMLLMTGEYEVVFDQELALRRAAALVPHIETEMVKGAGHVLTMEQPEYVNKRVLAFLGE